MNDPATEALRMFRQYVKSAREADSESAKVRDMAIAISYAEAIDKSLTDGGVLPAPWRWTTDDRIGRY